MTTCTPRVLGLLLAAALCATSCGDDTTPTEPTRTPTRTTEIFQGTIRVGGSQFYSFGTSDPGTTNVTLVSLRPEGSTTATASTVMGLGLGTPSGTDCALASAITTAPGLIAQLTATTNVSTYCVKIADVGNLRSTVNYTVRILHP
jgi:hypothetical protein